MANLGAGQSRTLGAGNQTLGYEWDLDVDNGFRPRGTFQLSSTTVSGVESFTDFGTFTKQGTTQTHHLTEYKAPSGAIVFGAGTVQWAWGLDDTNAWNNNGPPAGATPDPVMQQATVNLFADMGVPATTLMSGLTAVSQSTDTTAPNSTISSPTAGAAITDGSTVTISGTASDAGGQVAGIEVSTDGGSIWHPATGTTSWSYSWNAHGSPTSTIMSRAIDDSGNVESSSPSITVNVGCPCTMAGPNMTPWILDQQDPSPVEVGVRFKADMDGTVTGVRFYKSTANTGSHVGNLWTNERDAARHRDLQRRERLRLAAAELHHAGRHHGRDDVRGVLLRAQGALLGLVGVLLHAQPRGWELARQPAPARHQRQPRRRQRRLLLLGLLDLPVLDLRRRELRGRRRLRAQAPAGRGEQRHGHARPGLGDGQLHGARHGRPAHALHRHPVHRHRRRSRRSP